MTKSNDLEGLIREGLLMRGADGLVNVAGKCWCGLDNLASCGLPVLGCEAARAEYRPGTPAVYVPLVKRMVTK